MTSQTALLLLSIATTALGFGVVLVRTGRQFGVLETRIDGLQREMGLRFEVVDRRFEAVDQRFEAVDQRFDGMDQRFDGIDRRLDRMDDRFDRMDDRMERMQGQLTDVQVTVARMDQRLIDHVLDPAAHGAT